MEEIEYLIEIASARASRPSWLGPTSSERTGSRTRTSGWTGQMPSAVVFFCVIGAMNGIRASVRAPRLSRAACSPPRSEASSATF